MITILISAAVRVLLISKVMVTLNSAQFSLGKRLLATGLITLTLGSVGCTTQPNAPEQTDEIAPSATSPEGSAPDDSLEVVTTILPITQFTLAVAGDRAEVTQLLPVNIDPHAYQAKPGDIQAIATADVLVKNGLGLEFYLDDAIANAGNPNLAVIDSSAGIATFDLEFEGDGHNHGSATDDDHAHDHDQTEKTPADTEGSEPQSAASHQHAHGDIDPHIWLDPKRAIQQVENIRDGLIAADPAGAEVYTANAAAYIDQLQALDAEIAERLAPYSGQTFISFHDFAAYFADSYGLEVAFLVDVPAENPAPEDLRRIIDVTTAENIKAFLTEPQAGADAFASLSKDLNVQVGTFDPIAVGSTAALDPDYYLATMRQNVANLEAAFGAQRQSRGLSWTSPAIAFPTFRPRTQPGLLTASADVQINLIHREAIRVP